VLIETRRICTMMAGPLVRPIQHQDPYVLRGIIPLPEHIVKAPPRCFAPVSLLPHQASANTASAEAMSLASMSISPSASSLSNGLGSTYVFHVEGDPPPSTMPTR